jgi:hypothetical protein
MSCTVHHAGLSGPRISWHVGHRAAVATLARLLPELSTVGSAAAVPLPADGERLMLQTAVERVLLQAGLQAVAVDDLHFADDASLEMLTALAGSDALAPIAWVFT